MWYLWISYYLIEMEIRNVGKGDQVWENLPTFGFEEGRSAIEILTAFRLMVGAILVR